MTSIQGRGRLRRERPSVAPSVAFFVAPPVASSVAPPSSSPPPESESSEQLNEPLELKSPAAATSVPKYSEDDLQQIFKTVLEA